MCRPKMRLSEKKGNKIGKNGGGRERAVQREEMRMYEERKGKRFVEEDRGGKGERKKR